MLQGKRELQLERELHQERELLERGTTGKGNCRGEQLQKKSNLWAMPSENFRERHLQEQKTSGIEIHWEKLLHQERELLEKGTAEKGNCRRRAIFGQCLMSFIEIFSGKETSWKKELPRKRTSLEKRTIGERNHRNRSSRKRKDNCHQEAYLEGTLMKRKLL